MALELLVTDPNRGIESEYWRISNIAISLGPSPRIEFQLDGFRSPEIRNLPAGLASQFRPLQASGAAAMALILRSAGAVLRAQGQDVDSWPAECRAAVDGLTFYSQAASTLYGHARANGFTDAVDV